MPSAKQFAFLRDTVRNHPVVVASGAATGGVLLGACVAIQLLATPQPRVEAPAPQAALAPPAAAKPVAETTGSAPAGDSVASANCERQAWPYLSRPCMEEMRSRNRTRVISTDKLDKPTITAIEASPPAPAIETKPAAPAPVALPGSSVAPAVQPTPVTAATPPVPATAIQTPPAATAVLAAPEPPTAAKPAATPPAKPQAPPAARHETTKEKRIAKTPTRQPKAPTQFKAPKRESDDDDDSNFASNDSYNRGLEARGEGRSDRRIVERWTERDYDVPAASGHGQRRVTVIRRGGGGLFESLFGD